MGETPLGPEHTLPKLCVFDLDYTLWPLYVDCLSGPPFKRSSSGQVADRSGSAVRPYQDAIAILHVLRENGVMLGVASRTEEPEWAKEILGLMGISHLFEQQEIYPGSKVTHFRSIHRRTGIAFTDMLFFDDEHRNIRDVSALGVTSYLVNNGVSMDELRAGLDLHRERRQSRTQ